MFLLPRALQEAEMALKPNTGFEMLELLVSRNGQVTRVIRMDGEPMKVRSVRQVTVTPKVAIELSAMPSAADYLHLPMMVATSFTQTRLRGSKTLKAGK